MDSPWCKCAFIDKGFQNSKVCLTGLLPIKLSPSLLLNQAYINGKQTKHKTARVWPWLGITLLIPAKKLNNGIVSSLLDICPILVCGLYLLLLDRE